MAAVTFGWLWLNPASDVTAGRRFKLTGLEHDPTVIVTSQLYAPGVYAMVETPGAQKTAKVTLGSCTDADVAQLKSWLGVLLCFRDPTGEKFYGFYGGKDAPSFQPRMIGNSWSVTLTVEEITYSEAV